MYIKALQLIQKDNEVIRKVNFHSGINFVVDEEKSSIHNHVGKTTFLKLIDIALGSKDKAFLYTDAQTNTKNVELENLIDNNKIFVELKLSPTLDSNDENIILKVDLFKRGHKYINGEKQNAKEYNAKLNKILFDNIKNKPTFRQLIPYFVRVSAKRDNYDFLKNLHPNTKITTYRSIYDYLFTVSDSSNSEEISALENLKTELDQYEKSEKNYRSLGNNDQQNDILVQKINTNNLRKDQLEHQIEDLVKGTDFLKNREEITQARNKYIDLKEKLDDSDYKLKMVSDDIQESNSKSLGINNDLTKDFFNEIKTSLPEIDKSYQDLIRFNNALKNNKINYLKDLKKQIQIERDEIQRNIEQFLVKNKNVISLVKNNDISKYDELNKELSAVSQNIIKQEEILNTLEKYSAKKKDLIQEINSLQNKIKENSDDFEINLAKFNSYFTKLVSSINQGDPMIAYHHDLKDFPVSVEDLNEGTSSGTLKSLILCYDIAYQQFAKEINKIVPNFVVHDVLESISGDVLQKLINKINSLDIQVIIAILKEKLDSSQISSQEQKLYTVLSLSNKNRVFEADQNMKFSEKDVQSIIKNINPK
ncbi:hypothetical protein QU408_03595 [Lactobacillus crispatus]|uniref:hypothetical protein n=1 Tax=Lactobacillus crispatus TaxID=47770 RepID=UPI003D6A35E1